MRILPMAYFLRARDGRILTDEGVQAIHDVSSLTHGHPRSHIACVAYCNVAYHLLEGESLASTVSDALSEVIDYYTDKPAYAKELHRFSCLATQDSGELVTLAQVDRDDVRSSGYVVDTLDAALWCLMNHDGYPTTVLAAVNLGSDTDTTGAVCGALAGIYYQRRDNESLKIPADWLAELGNKEGILGICRLFEAAIGDLTTARETRHG
jgi:ADP-ribosylglycohydrolase